MFSRHETTVPQLTLILLVTFFFIQAVERTGHAQDKRPADVYQLTAQLAQEVDKLRWYMGRPVNEQAPPVVTDVSPHEVYFQAKLLVRKSSKLSFELTFGQHTMPATPIGQIKPRDVYELVRISSSQIRQIAEELNLEDLLAPLPPLDPTKTPTDVFKLVVQTSRQLNLLIYRNISPSDVYQTVTTAISYTDVILNTLPNPPTPPQAIPVTPGKRPEDVFAKLHETYGRIETIGKKMGLDMMTLERWTNSKDIQPSDVLDLASTIVAGLAHIHENTNGADTPHPIRWQHGMFPSDVFNRVLVLESQLDKIEQRL
ncbi:MAG: hypothetical protein CL942_02755 [Desulfovibrio sp.]|nr:hypothetical protein [Desulfovibrio sp.]|tara:strand:- start:10780 stop:11721 length:942 start_codon:yes stop_codon:yes gene_type:complete